MSTEPSPDRFAPASDEELFAAAAELPVDDRSRYLSGACRDDSQRRRVEGLLARAADADAYFDEAGATQLAGPQGVSEGPGTVVGPYKLLQKIGEGGFGSVFMAEQREPINRRVALKIIKQGMDTRDLIARFEAERQAIAMMDHPNIAKVYDAGATPSGRPYFVMELVRGVPLLRFCDEQKYDIRQRLDLFLDICSAVNHAHQKGIIHRDLKPSNILVTLHGDKPVPKIIDFGIAKATQQKLTDKTLFTRFEQMVGTPLYMSPEQASFSGLDVDTRTDIYALGVLLYEVLAGRPPFDPASLIEAGYDEMRRIIREEEPPRPSTRVSTLQGEDRSDVAATHRTEPERLGRLIKGDLDWIVMKAMEKDRSRRYETADGFALDIRRYLNHEAVAASPPGTGYKLRKFVRRNKAACAAAAAVLLALLLGVGGTSWGMLRAKQSAALADRERQRAETELARATAIKTLLFRALTGIDPAVAQGADTTLLEAILATSKEEVGQLQDPVVAAEMRHVLGDVYYSLGKRYEAEQQYLDALALLEANGGEVSQLQLSTLNALGLTYVRMDRPAEARQVFERNLTLHESFRDSDERDRLRVRTNIALTLKSEGRFEEARDQLEEILPRKIEVFGASHEDTLKCHNNLGVTFYRLGEPSAALQQWSIVRDARTAQLGPAHPLTIGIEHNVANARKSLGDFVDLEDEIATRRRIYETSLRSLQPAHHFRLMTTHEYADALYASPNPENWRRAIPVCMDIIALVDTGQIAPDHSMVIDTRAVLAEVYSALGQAEEASKQLEASRAVLAAGLEEADEPRKRIKLAAVLLYLAYLGDSGAAGGQGGRESLESQLQLARKAVDTAGAVGGPPAGVVVDAWRHIGMTLTKLGESGRACEAFETALELAGQNDRLPRYGVLAITALLGEAYVETGRHEEAVALLGPAMAEMPEVAAGHPPFEKFHNLARQSLALARGGIPPAARSIDIGN